MTVLFSKKAQKYLLSLPKRTSLNLLSKIEQIPKGDIRPFRGRKGEYQLRFGKYRVLFYIEKETVGVFKIDTRGDVYK